MPIISHYGCNLCDIAFPEGWGGYCYAVDDVGARIVCPHPLEFDIVQRVTGLNYTAAIQAGRTGFAQHCVCLECSEQIDLDVDRDDLVCPSCKGREICTLLDLVGKPCPKCHRGVIEQGSPIQWKLDPDWESLPVPQIVKDLTTFSETLEVAESLHLAVEVTEDAKFHDLQRVAAELLAWWEGDYYASNQDPEDSLPMPRKLEWSKALPKVLAATPELAALIVVRKHCCYFGDSVNPDVRRGIKNYLRKNRSHFVIS